MTLANSVHRLDTPTYFLLMTRLPWPLRATCRRWPDPITIPSVCRCVQQVAPPRGKSESDSTESVLQTVWRPALGYSILTIRGDYI